MLCFGNFVLSVAGAVLVWPLAQLSYYISTNCCMRGRGRIGVRVPHASEEASLGLHLAMAQASLLSSLIGRVAFVLHQACELGATEGLNPLKLG